MTRTAAAVMIATSADVRMTQAFVSRPLATQIGRICCCCLSQSCQWHCAIANCRRQSARSPWEVTMASLIRTVLPSETLARSASTYATLDDAIREAGAQLKKDFAVDAWIED